MVKSSIEIKKLSKNYGDSEVIRDITFKLPQNGIYGILGNTTYSKAYILLLEVFLIRRKCLRRSASKTEKLEL